MRTKFRLAFFLLGLLGSISASSHAQAVFDPRSSETIMKFEDFDFAGKFAALVQKDEESNYFLVDVTKLPTQFELMYFLKLTREVGYMALTDHGLTKQKAWFQVNKKYQEAEILKMFSELKNKVEEKATLFSKTEKEQWIKDSVSGK